MRKKSQDTGAATGSSLTIASRFAALAACLGEPPLLEGEDRAAYETLSEQILGSVEPRDGIEFLWVRDVIDLTWEIQRLRRIKSAYLGSCKPKGLRALLEPRVDDYHERMALIHDCVLGNQEAEAELDLILSASKLTRDAITAESFAAKIDDFEKFERMIAQAETRRLNIIREVDRHREALGRQLREATDVKDAEFRVIDDADLEVV